MYVRVCIYVHLYVELFQYLETTWTKSFHGCGFHG